MNKTAENRIGIIIRSFLRISVIPVIVFCVTAWFIINTIEPGFARYGCVTYPEDVRGDLMIACYIMLLYLSFTPVVLLNLIHPIARTKHLRLLVLLIPIVPALFGFVGNVNDFQRYGGRGYLYLCITALITTYIITWNARAVSRKLTHGKI